MAKFSFGCRFHDLKYCEIGYISNILQVYYKFDDTIIWICKEINLMELIVFQTNFKQLCLHFTYLHTTCIVCNNI